MSNDAKELREQASLLAPGCVRDLVLRAARRIETAANLERWANSPELQPPR